MHKTGIKAPHTRTRGHDAGKKIVGRKRHIAVDISTTDWVQSVMDGLMAIGMSVIYRSHLNLLGFCFSARHSY